MLNYHIFNTCLMCVYSNQEMQNVTICCFSIFLKNIIRFCTYASNRLTLLTLIHFQLDFPMENKM